MFESLRTCRDFPHKLCVGSPPGNKICWRLCDYMMLLRAFSGLLISKRRRKGEMMNRDGCLFWKSVLRISSLCYSSLTVAQPELVLDYMTYQSTSKWWSKCSVSQTALKQLRSHSTLSKNIWALEKMQSRGETKGMTSATKSLWHSQWGIG